MSFQDITYEEFGAIVRISHNRPQQRNAETPRLLHELDAALAQAEANKEIRVIILAATGDHFSAGHDVKEAEANRKGFTVEQRWELEHKIYLQYCLRIWDCPKPIIAQVQGACIAGGFMVANMADIMIASDDAFFADPVLQSLGAAAVEVLVHPYALGFKKAKEFLFTGARLSAQEAKECGMVNRVVPRDELEEATFEMAKRISCASPFALQLTKRSINRAAEMGGFRSAIQAHFDTHQLSHVSSHANAIRDSGFGNTIGAAKSASAKPSDKSNPIETTQE